MHLRVHHLKEMFFSHFHTSNNCTKLGGYASKIIQHSSGTSLGITEHLKFSYSKPLKFK